MKKHELFEKLEKEKYEYEAQMERDIGDKTRQGMIFTLKVRIRDTQDNVVCRRELMVREAKTNFFTFYESDLDSDTFVYTSKDTNEDIYGMFWSFVKTGKVEQ